MLMTQSMLHSAAAEDPVPPLIEIGDPMALPSIFSARVPVGRELGSNAARRDRRFQGPGGPEWDRI